MILTDLYCGAGLAHDGYLSVGFEPEGYDVNPQPHYPSPFFQKDAIEILQGGIGFGGIHASPPCQLFTDAKHLRKAQGSQSKEKVDLLTPTIALLRELHSDVLWVVENVDDRAKMCRRIMAPREGEWLTMLCGSMFRLGVQRHRLFLTNFPVTQPACRHDRFEPDPLTGRPRPWGVYHTKGDSIPSGGRTARDEEHGRRVMGSWRTLPWDSLKEGFPPQYTAYIGSRLLQSVTSSDA